MKKIGIVLFILIFPVFVSAGSFSSDTSKANNYLQRDTFYSSYKKYLLYNNLKFGFNNGKPETNGSFTMGGFISEGEYKLTIPNKGSSYLLTGDPYWTLTRDGSKYKVIEYNGSNTNELNSYESSNTRPKARVTEYVAPNTSVSGTGRQTDPWIFDPMFRVDFEILGGHATINGSSEDDGKKLSNIYLRAKCKGTECTKTITLTIEDGYNFISDTCDGSYNYERNEYTVNNLTKDVECKLTIGIGKFHVNLVKGDWEETRVPSPDNVYLRQRENYYRENEYKNIIYKLDTNPERYGYTFKGYNIKDTNIKIIDNTGKFIDKTSIKVNNQEIISDWQKNIYTLTFNPNGGTINASETTKQVTFDEAYGVLPLATRAGYSFKGWFTSASNNEQIKSTDIVKYAGNRTLYAQWTICPVGTYNTGNKTTCTSCPSGYTSVQRSTAENQCYMKVPGGKYLTARASSALPCEKGTSRNGEVTRYYGESVSCVDCTAGTYQNSTGQTSCKTCPTGYNSGIKATAENQCFITVPTGNKLIAKASSPTQCEAGTARNGSVVKNYGDSLNCMNCTKGTYSTGGASTCTKCPNGYTSDEKATAENKCYISVPAGKKLAAKGTPTNCDVNTYRANTVTKYYGESVSCTGCPVGYGVAAGSGVSQTSCTMSVSAGRQLTAKASSSTNCGANTWRSGPTTVAYGSSVSCTGCPSGYGVAAGSGTSQTSCTMSVPAGKKLTAKASSYSNCDTNTWRSGTATVAYGNSVSCAGCPAGYGVAAGSGTAQTSCYMSVGAGQYLNAYASSTTSCPPGQFRSGTATVYYGSSIGCSNCGANTYSGTGWGSCTACPGGTYSGVGASGCTGCGNSANVAWWSSGCTIGGCNGGYTNSNNSCIIAVASNTVNGVTSYYTSLQAALTASTTGTTTLLMDRSEGVSLPGGYDKVLNLNGKTLYGNVINSGTLRMNGNGTITLSTTGTTVFNYGTFIMDNGTIRYNVADAGNGLFSHLGTIHINGGSIISSGNAVVVMGGTGYINGATLTSTGTTTYVCTVGTYASAYLEVNNSAITAAKDHGYVCNNNTCSTSGCVEGIYDTPDPGNKVIVGWGSLSGGRGIYSRSAKAPVIYHYKKNDNTWVLRYSTKATVTRCATWTNNNGQDDIKWTNASCYGEIYSGFDRYCQCEVKKSDHKNETGSYITHFYNGNTFINDVNWTWP